MEIGCMASLRDVGALPETGEVVRQAKACDAEGALAAAAATETTEEDDEATQHDGESPAPGHQEVSAPEHAAEAPPEDNEATTTLQEQHDGKAPVPDHQDASAPEHAAEAPAAAPAPEEHGDEKADQVAKEQLEPKAAAAADGQESTRERLKRHRREMAGRVWVPEKWGQEKLLKDWVDCAVFDRPMMPTGLLTARRALIAECRSTRRPDRTSSPSPSTTTSSGPLPVRNGCS